MTSVGEFKAVTDKARMKLCLAHKGPCSWPTTRKIYGSYTILRSHLKPSVLSLGR
jgi:hypothetical protein